MSLKINGLSKRFGEKTVFDNFNFSFDSHGAYIVTGESGIGKTTLLRMIAGLDNDFTGTIENGGIALTSFMFQEYRLFPTVNALKNASVANSNDAERKASELLIKLGFNAEDLKKKPRELSGGMKQRVAFVRAVMKDSKILILDEPTKELDSDTAKAMLDIVNDEAKRRLVIIVTHDDIKKHIENAQIISL